MSEPMRPFPMLRYLLQFFGFSLLLIVAMLAFSVLIRIALPQGVGIALLVLNLLLVAINIARRERREPTRAERAWFATWASLLATLFSALLLAAMLTAVSGSLHMLVLLLHAPAVLLASLAFGLVLTWLITYFTLGLFVRQVLKLLARRDQSAAKQ